MRLVLPLAALVLATALLAGCTGGTGTLVVQASDPADNIADFASLTVQLSGVRAHSSDGGDKDLSLQVSSVDVVQLQGGNLTTLARQDVAAGNYTWIKLDVTSARGTLRAGGNASVDVPSDMLKLNGPFEVKAGATTNLRVDLHVVKQGNGTYSLRPVIGSVG
jgi:hypothetical protein